MVTVEPQEILIRKPQGSRRGRDFSEVETRSIPVLIETDYKENKDEIERGIDGALCFVRQGQTVPIHIEHGLPFIEIKRGKEDDEIVVNPVNNDGLNVHNINDFAVILEALLRRNCVVTVDLGKVKKYKFARKESLLQTAWSLSSGHLNGMILDEVCKIRVDAVLRKTPDAFPAMSREESNFNQEVRHSIKSRDINESEYLNRHVYVRFENCKGVYLSEA